MRSKSQLPLILTTAFLDLLGFSIFMPVLPDITAHFHQAEAWTMWAQSVYAIGMFFAGFIIGNLSDKYGRKNMLIFTTSINIIGYVATLVALELGSTTGFLGFALYLGARLIAGVGGSGFAVVQAYISDISSPAEKTKNMGLMGAAFGTAFLIGPAIGGIIATGGGIFSHGWGINGILYVSIVIITINLLWIIFGLPEPKHHIEEMPTIDIHDWKITNEIYLLLFISTFITIGFSVIQAGSGQYYADKFDFDADMRGYTMAVVGLISIIFQGFLVKYVRKIFDEYKMMYIGLLLVALGMILLAVNPYAFLVFFIVILFPLGMGSLGPSLTTLLAKDAGKHTGRVMGINTSMTGVGGIIGPILIGWLYALSIELPFWIAGGLFLMLSLISILYLKKK